jgi:hypothetical protein
VPAVFRLIAIIGLFAVLTVATASTVAGARPERQALTGIGTFVMPAGLACGDFDVEYSEIAFKQVLTTWTMRDGSTVGRVTGRYQIRLTNLETGAWIRVSIAGPLFIHTSADGTTTTRGTGNWGNWIPGEHPFLTSGQMDPFVGGMEGVLSTLRGHWSDICDHLD